ncbi:mycofactocin system FadH/OYE family oxidoreductase 2 [Mycobacteroides abscessus subsp. abscessus]|nr:mycofactocin system FadH/OYE family oxidoreductase 2 [Mycobacteroides abscessus subsp. abscessus]
MATTAPPLLSALPVLRAATTRPLLVSQAFRDRADLTAALAAGADLVGMARPFIADPAIATKLLRGEDRHIRPCVSCNEDCRSFTPVLLCSVTWSGRDRPDSRPPIASAPWARSRCSRPTARSADSCGRPPAPRTVAGGAGCWSTTGATSTGCGCDWATG